MDFSVVQEQIAQQDYIEWAGLITGLLYVILATFEKPSCWIFGILSSACIGWKSFTDYYLIADGILQVFYVVISFVGLMQWIRGATATQEKPIITHRWLLHVAGIGVSLLLSIPLSWLLIKYADARYGYIDTGLTLISIWATFLLIRKDLHNWVYWVIVDMMYTALYWKTEGYLFGILFLVYTVIAIWGWRRWYVVWQKTKMVSA